jgi:UDP-N-acetylglucosamine 4-epimerase
MKIQNKRVLVTGAAGFIGSNLVENLLLQNNIVIGLDNLSTGFMYNLDKAINNSNFTFVQGDIRDLETCHRACQNVDIVLHQAALGSVPRSLADPIKTNDVNIGGFLNMLVAARDAKVHRFVYASSSSVYGDSKELPKVEQNIGEALSPYAVTKQVNEKYANVFYQNYGLEVIGLRYFNVFGKHQSPAGEYAAVIPKFVDLLIHHKSPTIHGDGSFSRDFTYIDNVIQMNNLAATTENEEAIGEVFNTAVGETTNLLQLVNFLKENLSVFDPKINTIPILFGPKREGDIPHSWAEIQKAKIYLNYNPNYNIGQGIKISLAWYWEMNEKRNA